MRSVGPITGSPAGSRLSLRVQPRASRDEMVGVAGGAIRVRLTAPPVDGAANDALLRFLAARLGIPRSGLTLVSGQTGRNKVVEVDGIHHTWAQNVVGDALRQNSLAIAGDTVLRLPLLGLRLCADDFYAQIEEALRVNGWAAAA